MQHRLRFILLVLFVWPLCIHAQIGQHRNDLSVGINGGYTSTNIRFTPTIPQKRLGAITGGLSVRYVCEKYFSTIASVYGELNYGTMGWNEDIKTTTDEPVINSVTGKAEQYSRSIHYIQMPLFAHLAWGREHKGINFFVQAGPQFGCYLSESTSQNFQLANANLTDRTNKTMAQDTMKVENKFDYGIAAGAGLEYSNPHLGHILLEARYYYGLGNIYGDSKRDFFGSSNFGSIAVKLTYLFDIRTTKGVFNRK